MRKNIILTVFALAFYLNSFGQVIGDSYTKVIWDNSKYSISKFKILSSNDKDSLNCLRIDLSKSLWQICIFDNSLKLIYYYIYMTNKILHTQWYNDYKSKYYQDENKNFITNGTIITFGENDGIYYIFNADINLYSKKQ